MALSDQLFKAILAMDVYNRGYGGSLEISSNNLGNATLGQDSSILVDPNNGARRDEPISFFAQSYTWNGKTVISYRGTDNAIVDASTGFGLGAGSSGSPQSLMAAEFYRAINGGSIAGNPNIDLTGHSLGGGLAGFVGTIYGVDFKLFDNMAFEGGATQLLTYDGPSCEFRSNSCPVKRRRKSRPLGRL